LELEIVELWMAAVKSSLDFGEVENRQKHPAVPIGGETLKNTN